VAIKSGKNMHAMEQQLEAVFRRIQEERMQDVPVCNPALEVKAVGFREWGDYALGVMLTPWFMNLMLLPRNPQSLEGTLEEMKESSKEGSKQLHHFPSGSYEFIYGREEGLGAYQVCSLFSPMHEFADQETALETARQVLDAVMEESHRESSAVNRPTDKVIPEANAVMSRRDFLRGGRAQERAPGRGD
jgi:[NiFe] hydrogenase assembly HybE family chaperone